MFDAIYLVLAWLTATWGMTLLALSMEVHWYQVVASQAVYHPGLKKRARFFGCLGLFVSLLFCLQADYPPMAALVWIMMLAVAASSVAMILTWRPHSLRIVAYGLRLT